MARGLRTHLPNGLFHVTTQGVAGTAVFRDDVDRIAFLGLLAEVVKRYDWRFHAVCLLTTHYHLVLAAAQDDLSWGMKRLNGVHAQRFNVRHKRSGHLFGDRFSSRVIEGDAHYRAVLEYVRQNPVKAGLVDHADVALDLAQPVSRAPETGRRPTPPSLSRMSPLVTSK